MSERIDLTQFEKILNGPWSLVDGSEVLVCPTEECLGWCECGKGVPTKGPWIWQYIIGADIDTGRDLVIASVQQTIDEVMGWDNDGNYNLPSKEEGIAYATAKAVQMLPNLIAELKKMYAREDSLLDALRIIRDDLNEGMAQGHLPIESTHGVSARKIRNFANDAFESFKRRESND